MFASQIISMAVIILIILIFAGIIMLVLFHVCIVEWLFGRGIVTNVVDAMADRNNNAGTSTTTLSQVDIEKLPSYEFEAREKGSSPLNCVICLENFKVGDKCRSLPLCMHNFHANCVEEWLMKTPNCPTCRSRADSGRSENSQFSGFSVEIAGSQTTEDSNDTTSTELQEDFQTQLRHNQHGNPGTHTLNL